jgi:hypothetical protein
MSDHAKIVVAYTTLRANRDNWAMPEFQSTIAQVFYSLVSSIKNRSNIMSKNAFDSEGDKTDLDHCFSPYFIIRYIMNNADEYLNDFDAFNRIIDLTTKTIEVTKDENKALRKQTKNVGGIVYLKQSLLDKYKDAGIQLIGPHGEVDFPFTLPESLLEYEKRHINPSEFI